MTSSPAASASFRPILVAEDNVRVREALRDVLLLGGYEVAEAENGRIALERLFSPPSPCLVLLDLMMPVMTGSEFLWAGRSFAKRMGIPIVLLSGATDRRWAARQADRALAKPIDVDVLLSTIAELCH